MLRRRVAGVMITSLNSLQGFDDEGVYRDYLPALFRAGDRAIGGPSWSEEAVEYLERRGEFNG